MDDLLIEELLNRNRAQYLRDRMVSMVNPTFLQIYDLAYHKWGASNPSINLSNRQKMTTAWSVQDGINPLFSRITDCTKYAQFTGSLISDYDKKEAALVCLRRSQTFNQEYLDWKREANQTYAHLKLFF